ncbi:YdhK family protein [Janibacter corallicola]|uniref:YdhK family protein n=1 Tax=Janibacter corallicola TaxID=415212 RepID=UPI00083298BF|nr:YdhK family protein [Janibacter corallicola]
MQKRRTILLTAVLGAGLGLTGCGAGAQQDQPSQSAGQHDGDEHHGGMEHPMDGGPPPAGIEKAPDAKYPVGSTVRLTTDHMPGMKGARATIAGAYDTWTYSVDYTPKGGGQRVTDHKWVVQEELKDVRGQRLADGTKATLLADHMKGMKGAKATIASSTGETVYMVDYTADGMTMKNHKWVVESEIRPAK